MGSFDPNPKPPYLGEPDVWGRQSSYPGQPLGPGGDPQAPKVGSETGNWLQPSQISAQQWKRTPWSTQQQLFGDWSARGIPDQDAWGQMMNSWFKGVASPWTSYKGW